MMWSWILIPLGVLAFARAAYVTATYLIYWYESSQKGFPHFEEAGPSGLLALRAVIGVLLEILASLLVLLLYPVRMVLPARPGPPGPRRPLLLVHGHLLDLDFKRGHISALSDQVADCVEEIIARTGADRVDAVGHSLGGIVIFHTLLRGGGNRSLGTCVGLGAPFMGTRMAAFSRLPLVRQLAPGSAVLKDLHTLIESFSTPAPGTRLVSIWSNYDNVIFPTESPILPEPPGENVRVDFRGHVSLLFSWTVADQIRRLLSGSI
jgi:pimeloyl-ACP methyl ester carboxylesterase